MTLLWTVLAIVATLWPSHTLSMFRGAPLDGRAAAVLLGLAIPALCWIHRRYLDHTLTRALIVALLAFKIADASMLTQQGLCAKFSTAAPYATTVLTIPIEEPAGALRSWDARADWMLWALSVILARSLEPSMPFKTVKGEGVPTVDNTAPTVLPKQSETHRHHRLR